MAGQNCFCFPVKELSNERVKLTPFIASIHGPEYHALSSPHPSLYAHIRWGPFDTLADFTTNFLEKVVKANDSWMLYAIIDKTKPTSSPTNDPDGALAGMIGYSDASVEHLSTNMGIGITLPAFQRTYVTANAYDLLLQYALDPPKRGGLGLRRVQYNISSANCGSR
ncbi:MAG: hypothetical protein Q9228_004793, partial [Teloschistes exilis]